MMKGLAEQYTELAPISSARNRDADRLFRGSQAVGRRGGKETLRRGGDQMRQARLRLGRVETATHEIDARLLRGGGFLGRFHVNMGEAALSP